MPEPTTLFIGLLFGAIGFGYFLYGKKQKKLVPLICGITLITFPYFVDNPWIALAIGTVTSILPYFIQL
ncbi:MAG: hypothetical protein KDD48_06320 [Bdellovibrionales bacterium]|nr:hypothetical protein [Bdellovibrionales bacterium]